MRRGSCAHLHAWDEVGLGVKHVDQLVLERHVLARPPPVASGRRRSCLCGRLGRRRRRHGLGRCCSGGGGLRWRSRGGLGRGALALCGDRGTGAFCKARVAVGVAVGAADGQEGAGAGAGARRRRRDLGACAREVRESGASGGAKNWRSFAPALGPWPRSRCRGAAGTLPAMMWAHPGRQCPGLATAPPSARPTPELPHLRSQQAPSLEPAPSKSPDAAASCRSAGQDR